MIADRLRAAILQAAISGRLTDQRPEDGTAEELLEHIVAERAALVKKKKIKKQKLLPRVNADDQAFVLPTSWSWISFGETISLLSGRDLTPEQYSDRPDGIPYITGASNFANGSIIVNRWTAQPLTVAHRGDLLITCKGTIGDLAVLEESEAHIARQIMAITCLQVRRGYIAAFLEYSVAALKAQAKSMIPGISRDMLLTTPLPLPPLAEQERIVAKLDALLPLIDQLAELEREREYLDREFAKAIERAILQAAISGKLTKQHPEDGTAEELLETIKTERQQLEKEGRIKKQKPLPSVEKTDEPLELPDTWEWAQIGSIVDLINGRAYKRQELQTSGKWPVLRVGNLFTNETWYYSDLDLEDDKYCSNGDLLYAWSASFGPHIWRGEKSIFHYHIWKVRHYSMNRDYLNYVLQWDVERIRTATTGSTMVHVSMTNMRPRTIPVAPIEEQDRIVKRLDSLLPLVDQIGKLVL
ncbi:hypothetical protein HMPREF0045_00565 [Actinomyces graevenitzii C83]|uniref:Type I restriction modification DNA specificity domain-containing protein n=1 Tax=Actinomyces graevenitzii C83 TaxID=435830 RepID=G9PEH2_9ACTO|nr:restriction endonuclease subunit S [Actinomyces graevenitzii]EHM89152.1 hypothetical protein HMPREF0045_00565 [Actinomyces graevenitzii C83]